MYSRNNGNRHGIGEYSIPPGYDGSRFRRRRRTDGNRDDGDEIILVPDSGFAPVNDSPSEESNRELSVGGIPTSHGVRQRRHGYAVAEDDAEPTTVNTHADESAAVDHKTEEKRAAPQEKLSGILEKLGFTGGMSSDELLICAVIFLIASDVADDGRSVGDILLILALLLGIR